MYACLLCCPRELRECWFGREGWCWARFGCRGRERAGKTQIPRDPWVEKCSPGAAVSPGAAAGFGECPCPAPSRLPGSSRRGSSAGGSALPGPVVSREMLTPLTRCQNTNTQPDSLKSNYEGAAEPGLAFDSEESCKRHQRRRPAPAQCGPGTFLTGNNPVCLPKCGHLRKFRVFLVCFIRFFPFLHVTRGCRAWAFWHSWIELSVEAMARSLTPLIEQTLAFLNCLLL